MASFVFQRKEFPDDPVTSVSEPAITAAQWPSPRHIFNESAFTFKQIRYSEQGADGQPITLLKGVSGTIPSQSVCGLVGPPDAGCTQLAEVLAGFPSRKPGKTTVWMGRLPSSRRVMLVSQEDSLLLSETVMDVMRFHTNLCMPRSTPEAAKRDIIQHVMTLMDLARPIQEAAAVASLSRVDRWRLHVCAVLISQPDCIIFMEPTAGLSTSEAVQMIRMVKKVCRSMYTTSILCCANPNNAELSELDHLLLMAKGHMVYCGTLANMMHFVARQMRPIEHRETPATYAMTFMHSLDDEGAKAVAVANLKALGPLPADPTADLSSTALNDCLPSVAQDADVPQLPNVDPLYTGTLRRWRVRVLMARIGRMYTYPASPEFLADRLAFLAITGCITSALFTRVNKEHERHTQNFINMLTFFCSLLQCFGTVSAHKGIAVRARWYAERGSRMYQRLDWFLSFHAVETLVGLVFAVGYYFAVWMPAGWGHFRWGSLLASLALCCLSVQALRGVPSFVIMLCRDHQRTIAPMLLVSSFMMVTMGAFLHYERIPLTMRWACFVNPLFYLFMGLMILEWKGNAVACDGIFGNCPQGNAILAEYGFDAYSVQFCLAMQTMLIAMYMGLTYLATVTNDFSVVRRYQANYGRPPVLKVMDVLWHIPKTVVLGMLGQSHAFSRLHHDEESTPLMGGGGGAGATDSYEDGIHAMYSSVDDGAALVLDDARLPPVLQYTNVAYRVADAESGGEREVLRRLSFAVQAHTMFAILGPKQEETTTLLQVLGGCQLPGQVYADAMPELGEDLGYVPCDTPLPPFDTVGEVLTFYAEFAMPTKMTTQQVESRATQVLMLMGLYSHRNSYIGGDIDAKTTIEGAPLALRRRVALAVALLRNPSVLMVDRATSGLDAAGAMDYLGWMQRLVRHGCTLVCTLDGPVHYLVYAMFAHVLYLAQGELVYLGPPDASTAAFEAATGKRAGKYESPRDFALDCLSDLEHEEVAALMDRMPPHNGPVAPAGAAGGADTARGAGVGAGAAADEPHSLQYYTPEPGAAADPFSLSSSGYGRILGLGEDSGEAAANAAAQVPALRQRKAVAKISRFHAFRLLHKRLGRAIWRDPELAVNRLWFFSFTAFCIAVPFTKLSKGQSLHMDDVPNRLGCIVMTMVLGLCQACETIAFAHHQRRLYYHEINLGLYKTLDMYWTLCSISITVFALIGGSVAHFLIWGLVGYRQEHGSTHEDFWLFGWFNTFNMYIFAEMLSLFFAMLVQDTILSEQLFQGMFVGLLLPLSGLFISSEEVPRPIRVMSNAVATHYIAQAEVLNQFWDRKLDPLILDPGNMSLVAPLHISGNDVIHSLHFDEMTGSKRFDTLIVLAQAVVFGVTGFFLMARLVRRKLRRDFGGTRYIGKAYVVKVDDLRPSDLEVVGEDPV